MKELLFTITKKDFTVQTMRAGGKGGQNQNKVSSAVRIVHKASGAMGVSRSSRDQPVNKKLAFQHLVESTKFKAWLKMEIAKHVTGKSVEQIVNEQMNPRNLWIEIIGEGGRWVGETQSL